MAIDFPNSPTTNQTFTSGSTTWKYDGSKWKVVTSPSNLSSATPDALTPDQSGAAGSSSDAARADHAHEILTAAASTITGTNAEGTSTSFARADHNHDLSITPSWTALTLSNSWINYDTTNYESAAYYKDKFGFVHLKGLLKSGTINAVMFTLPSGARPAKNIIIPNASFVGYSHLSIDSDGTVDASANTNVWISIDGVRFPAA